MLRGFLCATYGAMLDMAWVFRRCLELPLLVLCSTDDPITKATWKSLGFVFTSEEDLKVRTCKSVLPHRKRSACAYVQEVLCHMISVANRAD